MFLGASFKKEGEQLVWGSLVREGTPLQINMSRKRSFSKQTAWFHTESAEMSVIFFLKGCVEAK